MPPKGERRKQQIINTAKKMFIEKGFQSTHIGQVCEELDIARGTVYQYFSNKKEIIYSLLDTVVERIEDILDLDNLQEYLNNNPEEEEIKKFISTRVGKCIEVIINEPIIIKLAFKDISGISPDIVTYVNKSVTKIKSIIIDEIEVLKSKNFHNEDLNSKISASMLLGGIMFLVYEYDKNIFEADIIKSMTNIYFYGTLKK
jgi:AcrR family transcriptional regulator